jgi:hypothetical protein
VCPGGEEASQGLGLVAGAVAAVEIVCVAPEVILASMVTLIRMVAAQWTSLLRPAGPGPDTFPVPVWIPHCPGWDWAWNAAASK